METTFKFLKQLAKNNNKEWFDVNRKTYETLLKKNLPKL
jgi:uncharacterized protein (DUF2461 family)